MAGEGVLVVDDDHMLLDVVTSLLHTVGLGRDQSIPW